MIILLRQSVLINATETYQADILIDGEHIAAIAPETAEVIDCAGKFALPGGVDPHTHFDLPMFGTVSSDDHYTGHKAAAFGGTTTGIDFVPQSHARAPFTRNDEGGLERDVEAWRAKADPKAAVDFGFHMNITRFDQTVAAGMAGLGGHGDQQREGVYGL